MLKERLVPSGVIWPPIKELYKNSDSANIYWKITCILLIIPIVAILHHAVFYRPTCILNNFGNDYYVLIDWLLQDPSLPWGIIMSIIIYQYGKNYQRTKLFIAPIFTAFLPLSIWIWDIPFTGRIICRHFHDGRLMLFGEYVIRSRHFYVIGIFVYLILLFSSLRQYNKALLQR